MDLRIYSFIYFSRKCSVYNAAQRFEIVYHIIICAALYSDVYILYYSENDRQMVAVDVVGGERSVT